MPPLVLLRVMGRRQHSAADGTGTLQGTERLPALRDLLGNQTDTVSGGGWWKPSSLPHEQRAALAACLHI